MTRWLDRSIDSEIERWTNFLVRQFWKSDQRVIYHHRQTKTPQRGTKPNQNLELSLPLSRTPLMFAEESSPPTFPPPIYIDSWKCLHVSHSFIDLHRSPSRGFYFLFLTVFVFRSCCFCVFISFLLPLTTRSPRSMTVSCCVRHWSSLAPLCCTSWVR